MITLLEGSGDLSVGLFIGGKDPRSEVTRSLEGGSTILVTGQSPSAVLVGYFPKIASSDARPVRLCIRNGETASLVISMQLNGGQLYPPTRSADPDATDLMWLAKKADSGLYSLPVHTIWREIQAHGELRFELVLRRRKSPDQPEDRLKSLRRSSRQRLSEAEGEKEILCFEEVGRVTVVLYPRVRS